MAISGSGSGSGSGINKNTIINTLKMAGKLTKVNSKFQISTAPRKINLEFVEDFAKCSVGNQSNQY